MKSGIAIEKKQNLLAPKNFIKFTENYVRVQKPFDASSINQIEMVKLDKIQPDGTVSISPIFEEFLAKV